MLRSLSIQNAAVAKNVDIAFCDGFTVITGETGSGKSVMVDCLELLAGAKASKDIVRHGESRCITSAIYDTLDGKGEQLAALGAELDENGELIITRTVSSDGRSGIKANGRSMTLAQLKESSASLIGINTQDEKAYLADRAEYIRILDSYADNGELFEAYAEKYARLTSAKAELKALLEELKEKSMMTEILTYQVKEIDSARLTGDEELEKLERLRAKLKSAEKMEKAGKIVYKALSGAEKGYSAAYLLERAAAAIEQVSDAIEGADDMVRRLNEYRYDIIDIAETVSDALCGDIDGDPTEKLNQIESRLSLIERLSKKYGGSVAEIKAFRDRAAEKLKRYSESDSESARLRRRCEMCLEECVSAAEALHASRVKAAEALSEEIVATLRYLDMPKVRFFVEVVPHVEDGKKRFTPTGSDEVDFKLSVNPGESPMSMSRVASGGEMSRVMLALRSSINKKSGSGTVVFDEIDAGVSGSTSERIGLLLKKLSRDVQVICITHSPQIAALADEHYLISKHEVDGRAESFVTLLDRDGRVDELSRIIGGINVTEKQRAAAREMLSANEAETF